MKNPTTLLSQFLLGSFLLFSFAACHDHDHGDHSGHDHGDHSGHNHAAHEETEEEDAGIFVELKQQKAIGIRLEAVKKSGFARNFQVAAQVQHATADWEHLVAPAEGRVRYAKSWQAGMRVTKGSSLFTISTDNLYTENPKQAKQLAENELQNAMMQRDLAKTEFERAEKAIVYEVISQEEYNRRESALQAAESAILAAQTNLQSAGNLGNESYAVLAPRTATVHELAVMNGDYVQRGDELILLTENKNWLIEAKIPSRYVKKLSKVEAVTISGEKTPLLQGNDAVQQELKLLPKIENGYRMAQILAKNSADADFMAGQFLELIFEEKNEKNQYISIPKSALLEDFGSYYVFSTIDSIHFEKKFVTIAERGSETVAIADGLQENELIAVSQPQQIKLIGQKGSGGGHHGHAH